MSVVSTETRNSNLRKFLGSKMLPYVESLHEKFPWLTPDHVTLAGGMLVGGGSWLFNRKEGGARWLGVAMVGLGLGADGIDGMLARVISKKNGEPLSNHGQLLDAGSDRIKEWMMAEARVDDGNHIGPRITQITSLWPSLARAFAERRGVTVPETGSGWLGGVGTTIGRTALGLGALVVKGIDSESKLLKMVDPLVSIANVVTAVKRFKLGMGGVPTLQESMRDRAARREKVLLGVAGALAVASLTSEWLRNRKDRV